MSPRPAPNRHDATAARFLNAAALLIDASLDAQAVGDTPRLKSLHYPAALDWIRLEDVLRLAQQVGGATASKRALTNRWATKDEFIQDAIVHALLYRDGPATPLAAHGSQLHSISGASTLATGLTQMVEDVVQALMGHPRSFLLCHIAPLLPRHPQVAASLQESSREAQSVWTADYPGVLRSLGIRLRPDWPAERLTLAVQIILDGTLVRSRVEPDNMAAARWRHGSIYADTVLAVVASAIDIGNDGRTTARWLDDHVHRSGLRVDRTDSADECGPA